MTAVRVGRGPVDAIGTSRPDSPPQRPRTARFVVVGASLIVPERPAAPDRTTGAPLILRTGHRRSEPVSIFMGPPPTRQSIASLRGGAVDVLIIGGGIVGSGVARDAAMADSPPRSSTATTSPSAPAAAPAACSTAGSATWPRAASAWSAKPAAKKSSSAASRPTSRSRCRSSSPPTSGTGVEALEARHRREAVRLALRGGKTSIGRRRCGRRICGAWCRISPPMASPAPFATSTPSPTTRGSSSTRSAPPPAMARRC